MPDLASFPRRDWAWALTHACRSASVADIGDEAAGGSAALRTVLGSYLQRVRAAVVDAEHVVVVPGFRHGLHVVLRTLAASGVTRVGLEDPGPTDSDVIARASGLEPVPIPVDDEGLDVEALSRSAAGAVLVTPAHQCPTGVVLSARRRQALVEWARDRRRRRDRGRLRRRVPLRPPARRLGAGTGARPGDRDGFGQQDAGARRSASAGWSSPTTCTTRCSPRSSC